MVITGSLEAFKEYDSHRTGARVFLYTATPAGRVTAILVYPGVQWSFPAQENVTEAWLRSYAQSAIAVTSWTL